MQPAESADEPQIELSLLAFGHLSDVWNFNGDKGSGGVMRLHAAFGEADEVLKRLKLKYTTEQLGLDDSFFVAPQPVEMTWTCPLSLLRLQRLSCLATTSRLGEAHRRMCAGGTARGSRFRWGFGR